MKKNSREPKNTDDNGSNHDFFITMKIEKVLISLLSVTLLFDLLTEFNFRFLIMIEFTLISFNYMPLTAARLVKVDIKKVFTILSRNVNPYELATAILFCMSLAFSSIGIMFFWLQLPGWKFILFLSLAIGLVPLIYQLLWLKKWKTLLLTRYLALVLLSILLISFEPRSNVRVGHELESLLIYEIPNHCSDLSKIDEAISCAKQFNRNILLVVSEKSDEFTNQKIEDFKGDINHVLLRLDSEENELKLEFGLYILDSSGAVKDQIPIKSSYSDLSSMLRNTK